MKRKIHWKCIKCGKKNIKTIRFHNDKVEVTGERCPCGHIYTPEGEKKQ
jgi:DNA-directed RNA polymerase subunit RPC12/RpoP